MKNGLTLAAKAVMLLSGIYLIGCAPALSQTKLIQPVEILPTAGYADTGELRFRDKQSAFHYAGLKAPATISSSVVWKLPSSDSAGCLNSDGSANLGITPCVTVGTNQTITGLKTLQNHLKFSANDTYDIADGTSRVRVGYFNNLATTKLEVRNSDYTPASYLYSNTGNMQVRSSDGTVMQEWGVGALTPFARIHGHILPAENTSSLGDPTGGYGYAKFASLRLDSTSDDNGVYLGASKVVGMTSGSTSVAATNVSGTNVSGTSLSATNLSVTNTTGTGYLSVSNTVTSNLTPSGGGLNLGASSLSSWSSAHIQDGHFYNSLSSPSAYLTAATINALTVPSASNNVAMQLGPSAYIDGSGGGIRINQFGGGLPSCSNNWGWLGIRTDDDRLYGCVDGSKMVSWQPTVYSYDSGWISTGSTFGVTPAMSDGTSLPDGVYEVLWYMAYQPIYSTNFWGVANWTWQEPVPTGYGFRSRAKTIGSCSWGAGCSASSNSGTEVLAIKGGTVVSIAGGVNIYGDGYWRYMFTMRRLM